MKKNQKIAFFRKNESRLPHNSPPSQSITIKKQYLIVLKLKEYENKMDSSER
jgi:hypothetical protein